MSDRKGDPAKQPPECKMRETGRCPHLKETGGGFEGERYDRAANITFSINEDMK